MAFYGHGTWIDAGGSETHIPARFHDGEVVLSVPADVVAASRFPAVLDPIITVEVGTGATPTPVRAAWTQWDVHSGFDSGAGNHVVFWRDTSHPDNPARLIAARLDPSGAVLDPYGLSVARPATYATLNLGVTSGGGEHFLWWAYRESSSEEVVYGRRLDAATGVLGPELELRRAGDIFASKVAIATSGALRVMVWATRTDEIVAVTVDMAGAVSAPVVISSVARDRHGAPAVHWTGTDFLVVWTTTSGASIQGRRLDSSGVLIGTEPFTLLDGTLAGSLALAGGSSQQAVVYGWNSGIGAFGEDIAALLVTGETTSGPYVVIQEPDTQRYPAVSWDGTRYWIAVNDFSADRIASARLATDGTVTDAPPLTITSGSYQDSIGLADAPTPLLAYSNRTLAATLLDPATGIGGPELPVFLTAKTERFPNVVAGVNEYLVAWADYTDPLQADVYAARFDADGAPIGAVFPIAESAASETIGALGFDGTQYVAAWSHVSGGERDIWGARIALDGTVLDPGGRPLIAVAGSSQSPSSWSYDGSELLLSWTDTRGAGRYFDCYVARFDSALSSLDGTGLALTTNQRCGGIGGSTAVDGTHFVAWRLYVPLSTRVEARGSRVRRGSILDGDGLVLGEDRPVAVASDGYRFATVVVKDDDELWSAMVTPSGALDLRRFHMDSSRAWRSGAMAHDGSEYSFVFEVSDGGDESIGALTLDADGFLADAPFDVSTGEAYADGRPVLASLGSGTSLLAYSRYVYGAPFEAFRVQARTGTSDRSLIGDPCVAGTECGSGHCVDGVCCNSECGSGATDDCLVCSLGAGASEDGVCSPRTPGSACGTPTTCMPTECSASGACAPAAGPDCDDSEPCTSDSCVDPGGCAHELVPACMDMGPPDLGPPDLGPPDLGPPDLGPPDLGPPDLGPPDLGPPDLGPPDLGPPDLGPPDLGPPDLGPPDLGPPDSGPRDSGLPDGGLPGRRSGCGCASVGGNDVGGLTPFFLALGWVRRRRRKEAR